MEGKRLRAQLDLADLLLIAEAVLGTPAQKLAHTVRISAAESALAAPFASFDGLAMYPDPAERAAVCCSRLQRNHPFPEGNKAIGYECMREMLERERVPWPRLRGDGAEIASMIERLAARRIGEADFVRWVRERTESGGR